VHLALVPQTRPLLFLGIAACLITTSARAEVAAQSQPAEPVSRVLEEIRLGRQANSAKLKKGYLAWTCRMHEDNFRPGVILDTQSTYRFWWDSKRAAAECDQESAVGTNRNGKLGINGTVVHKRRAAYDHAAKSFVEITEPDSPIDVDTDSRPAFRPHADYFQTFSVRSPYGYDRVVDVFSLPTVAVSCRSVQHDGGELLLVTGTAKERNGQSRSETYLDPQRGFNIVRWEWFDENGRMYAEGNQELAQVAGGAWIPVARHEKSLDPASSRITVHNAFTVDLQQSRFNHEAVIPERVFRISALDAYATMAWQHTFRALGWTAPKFNWAYVFLGLLVLFLPVVILVRRYRRTPHA
jgi:hypothetical protein